MKYFEVKSDFAGITVANVKTRRIITTLIGGELYTENEMIKKGLAVYDSYFNKVNINQKRTYFCFGARFQCSLN